MNEIQDATNWKEIALALAQRVNFAMTNCKATGGLFNMETGEITPWRDYMAEAMEMLPGLRVDREIMATLDMPAAKRRKAQAAIKAQRSAAQNKGEAKQ